MHDDVELVRARVDIFDLVGERVQLKRSGSSWRGLCPFHMEKTPSFYVNPQRGRYTCFGCQATGDIFDWVMRTENLDFRGALEMLAQRAGVTLSKRSGPEADEAERAVQALEVAARFFRSELNLNASALDYVHSRGLDEATIEEWEIGFAPENPEALPSHIRGEGLRLEDAMAAGLLSGSPMEGYRPFFRGRVMFPIRNDKGRVVAFGGRAMGDDQPKYVNSRDSIVFNKSLTLYGLHRAKKSLMESRSILITEGYLDVIACHKAGVQGAVAPLGTAMNERHAELIKRWATQATLLYDSDRAGRTAARKASSILAAAGVSSRVAVLPLGSDPDSLFATSGGAALREVVGNAVSPLRFEVLALEQELGLGDDYWREARAVLAQATNYLERDQIIAELAARHPTARFGLQQAVESFRREVEALSPRGRRRAAPRVGQDEEVALPSAPERMILRAALRDEHRASVWSLLSEEGLVVSPPGRALAAEILDCAAADRELDGGELLALLSEASRAAMARLESPSEGPVTEVAIHDSIKKLTGQRDLRANRAAFESGKED